MEKTTKGQIWKQKQPLEFTVAVRRDLEEAMRSGRYAEGVRDLGLAISGQDPAHIERFLRNPSQEWLSREDISFLCGELGIEGSAFYLDRAHAKFLTRMNNVWIKAYDPMSGGFVQQPTQPLLENPGYLTASPDLILGFLNRRQIMPPSAKYTLAHYLVETGYTKEGMRGMSYAKQESPLQRLGKIQVDVVNCIPLVLYAALHSGKPIRVIE